MIEHRPKIFLVCQSCQSPLSIESSLDPAEMKEVLDLVEQSSFESWRGSDGVYDYNEEIVNLFSEFTDKYKQSNLKPTSYITQNNDTDSQAVNTIEIFDFLNNISKNGICDFPLCEECGDVLTKKLDRQILERDIDCDILKNTLLSYDKSLNADNTKDVLSFMELSQHTEELIENIKIKIMTDEFIKMSSISLFERNKLLKAKNKEFYSVKSNLEMQQYQNRLKLQIIENLLDTTVDQFVHKSHDSILSMAFNFSSNNNIATVNEALVGFRENKQINECWQSISVGLGHVALFLKTAVNLLNFELKDYTIIPLGPYSYIVNPPNKRYCLSHMGEFKILWSKSFNNGLAALMNCFTQLTTHITSLDSDFRLKNKMEGIKIFDEQNRMYRIEYKSNNQNNWNKAFILLFENLKLTAAWTSLNTGDTNFI